MHLSDGTLPGAWCAVWAIVALPFVVVALRKYEAGVRRDPASRPFVAMIAAAVFALSCMPVPVPVVGSCSHPCGTGLAAVLVGPWLAVLITLAALAIQALFLAHGGLTTLGADVFTMGVAGAFSGYAAFRAARALGLTLRSAGFLAGLVADWATYGATASILALGLSGDGGAASLALTISAAFVPTQVPLGILEGFLTAGALVFVQDRRPELLVGRGLGAEVA